MFWREVCTRHLKILTKKKQFLKERHLRWYSLVLNISTTLFVSYNALSNLLKPPDKGHSRTNMKQALCK